MRAKTSAKPAAAATFCLLLGAAAAAPAQPPTAPAGASAPIRMAPVRGKILAGRN
jgi:hypothetical protein